MPIARPVSAASRVSLSLSSMRPLGYDSREWNEIKESDFRNLRLSTYSRTSRTSNRRLSKQLRDPDLDINLPYRTLRDGANTSEYTTENEKGTITPPDNGTPDGKSNYELVTFFVNDPENPRNWSKLYKWYCTLVAAFTFAVVAFISSIITADFGDVAKEFKISDLLTLATFSVFVLGFGSGKYSVCRQSVTLINSPQAPCSSRLSLKSTAVALFMASPSYSPSYFSFLKPLLPLSPSF
jgi:hypothetical protein